MHGPQLPLAPSTRGTKQGAGGIPTHCEVAASWRGRTTRVVRCGNAAIEGPSGGGCASPLSGDENQSANSNFTSEVAGEHPRAAFLKIWPSQHTAPQRLLTRNPTMAGHGDGSCRRPGRRLNLKVQMRGSACSELIQFMQHRPIFPGKTLHRGGDSFCRTLPRTEICLVQCAVPQRTHLFHRFGS
jgi:hypothetical protein